MALQQLLRYLFPVLLLAGVGLSPFSAPAVAAEMGSEAMIAMAGDMQDCPSKQPAAPDCQKSCPLMMVCAANWVAGGPVFATSSCAFGVKADAFRPGNDAFGGPLTEAPPARPPRT